MTKNISKTVLLCFLLFTFPFQSNASKGELVERGGVLYEKFSNIPFTGQVSEKAFDGKVKNGKLEGEVLSYAENGQLKSKGNYKNDKLEGEMLSYHENGQLKSKLNFKNGKKEGEQLFYDENGQMIK
jgi:antitoxin component YwqK of YwqJK toxin-antitoxin module